MSPTKEIIFTAADPKYFNRFAAPLVVSAIDTGMPLYLGLCNPDDRSFATLGFISDYVKAKGAEDQILWAIEEVDLDPAWDKGVWAGCGRMRHAIKYWEDPAHANHKLFLLDMDSLLRKKFPFPSAPISLCIDPLRDKWGEPVRYELYKDNVWNVDCSRILMSGFFDNSAFPLLKDCLAFCEDLGYPRWGTDQLSLWKLLSGRHIRWWPLIYNFYGTNILQWGGWNEAGFVWTGKWNKVPFDDPYRKEACSLYRRFLKVILESNEGLNVPGLYSLFEE